MSKSKGVWVRCKHCTHVFQTTKRDVKCPVCRTYITHGLKVRTRRNSGVVALIP